MRSASHRTDHASRLPRTHAFSLIEVLLAMGIISIALLATIGIIPAGLKSMASARESSVEAQIIASVGSQMRLTPFSELDTRWGNAEFYFDNDGLPFIRGNRSAAAYHADVTSITRGLTLPGGLTTNSITRVHIDVEAYRHGQSWAAPFAQLVITIADDGS